MVDEIEAQGIKSTKVLEAMRAVPRHQFVTPHRTDLAYLHAPVPIEEGQTVSQPFIVAAMTEQLDLEEHDRVLEIGTGSGYQTAVLAELGAEVFTVESRAGLQRQAMERLTRLCAPRISFRLDDGTRGWPEAAPFDAIVATCAVPAIPGAWREQLAEGGRLVVPVGPLEEQVLWRIHRVGGEFLEEPLLPVRFVPIQCPPEGAAGSG